MSPAGWPYTKETKETFIFHVRLVDETAKSVIYPVPYIYIAPPLAVESKRWNSIEVLENPSSGPVFL